MALLEIDEFARATYEDTLKRMQAEANQGVRAWDQTELGALGSEIWEAYETATLLPWPNRLQRIASNTKLRWVPSFTGCSGSHYSPRGCSLSSGDGYSKGQTIRRT